MKIGNKSFENVATSNIWKQQNMEIKFTKSYKQIQFWKF